MTREADSSHKLLKVHDCFRNNAVRFFGGLAWTAVTSINRDSSPSEVIIE